MLVSEQFSLLSRPWSCNVPFTLCYCLKLKFKDLLLVVVLTLMSPGLYTLQDQIIASHTCIGGHVVVNC